MDLKFEFRLTSVWEYSTRRAVFSGVPLARESYRTLSGRCIIVVDTPTHLLPIRPCPGQHWRVYGWAEDRQVEHENYLMLERRFANPRKLELTLPHDGESFIRFVSAEPDFKGIGEVKARELWHTHGRAIYDVLASKDVGVLSRTVSTQAAISLVAGYEKYANLRYGIWMAEHMIPPQIQQRLFKFHGSDSVEEIKSDPYRLVTFGMSFGVVDELARDRFGVGVDDPRRLLAAVDHSLRQYSSRAGHTVAKGAEIYPLVTRVLGDRSLADAALCEGLCSRAFSLDHQSGSYHLASLLIMEKVVAKRLVKLRDRSPTWTSKHERAVKRAISALPYPLTDRQREAIVSSVSNSLSCITGGAGTGKTTVLKTVLAVYSELGYLVKAVALSGRAAMRLRQSTGFETSTIAKFLKDEPIDAESKTVLVIDEASMIDLGTMYRIVTRIHPSVRILLVGDPDQLPPIGVGLVLCDVLKSSTIRYVELDVVKRQESESGIPSFSQMIRKGEIPSKLTLGCVSFHQASNQEIARICSELYRTDPSNCRIIAATRAMTAEINELCQSQLNAHSQKLEFTRFGERFTTDLALNDPVLFTQNNYEAKVQNGSLGCLISVEQSEEHYGIVKLDDGDSEIELSQALLDSLELGYAITLHKAQGSQFPRVVVALGDSGMIDRSWLYSAVTRAEKELHLVGSETQFRRAISKAGVIHSRQTHLHRLLRETV